MKTADDVGADQIAIRSSTTVSMSRCNSQGYGRMLLGNDETTKLIEIAYNEVTKQDSAAKKAIRK